jgi:hypothetical protein
VDAGLKEWFAEHAPDHWGCTGIEVVSDPEEILVVVELPTGSPDDEAHGLGDIRRFRETTRDERMAIAMEAEQAFGRKVSWAARRGETVVMFTAASVPVMTRLRLPERRVLDTLIDAGVARSRSEALAWCVRLVETNEKEWIGELRTAFEAVAGARAKGPRSRRGGEPGGS